MDVGAQGQEASKIRWCCCNHQLGPNGLKTPEAEQAKGGSEASSEKDRDGGQLESDPIRSNPGVSPSSVPSKDGVCGLVRDGNGSSGSDGGDKKLSSELGLGSGLHRNRSHMYRIQYLRDNIRKVFRSRFASRGYRRNSGFKRKYGNVSKSNVRLYRKRRRTSYARR